MRLRISIPAAPATERLLECLHDPAQEPDAVGAVDDAVVVRERQRQHEARHELPGLRCRNRFGACRAKCRGSPLPGALTIGVKNVPPMPPRFEMLKQPPCISSSEIFARARFLRQLRELGGDLHHVLLVGVPDDRHEQAAVGVDGDADVDVFLDDDLVVRRDRSTS